MPDYVGALIAAAKGAGVEAGKRLPVVGELVEGVRSYRAFLNQEQEEAFIRAIQKRLDRLERFRTDKWFETEPAQEFIRKIVAVMLEATNADKIEYFANALANYDIPLSDLERLKFVELVRSLSVPALKVLAHTEQIYREKGPRSSPEVLPDEVTKASNLDPLLVRACINELYAAGVFGSDYSFGQDGDVIESLSRGTPAFTDFSERFTLFLETSGA